MPSPSPRPSARRSPPLSEFEDLSAIRRVVEDWAVWRDSGAFDRLGTCWHSDGRMETSWGSFDAAGFVAASRAGWERGAEVVHLLGGTSIELVGNRAVSQTKMTIGQRGRIGDILVDVTCTGRFYDLFERREGRWAIVLRQPIYERDRLDPVTPGAVVPLDAALLARFPAGYRHLAYLQTLAGVTVTPDLSGLRGAVVESLYARGRRWLARETPD